jgi:hypothetical protein
MWQNDIMRDMRQYRVIWICRHSLPNKNYRRVNKIVSGNEQCL